MAMVLAAGLDGLVFGCGMWRGIVNTVKEAASFGDAVIWYSPLRN